MSRHDVLLVDLDGTVYRGPDAIDGAVEALEAARGAGAAISYVTNNASRSPSEVGEHLARLGLTLTDDDVVTSAQAAAAVLADQLDAGAVVLVLGTDALVEELRLVGLTPVREADDGPVALVQGHNPRTAWTDLAEASLVLGRGVLWVACNVDPTLPSDRGIVLGNGSLVAALRHATGREPQIAGKPAAPLLRQAVERAGASTPLVIGDRLDTDVAGAYAIDAESLLVLTGVSTPAELLAAIPEERPTYVAAGLAVLGDALEGARVDGDESWEAAREDGVLVLSGSGESVAALRALCAVAWDGEAGDDGRAGGPRVRPEGDDAERVVEELGLTRA